MLPHTEQLASINVRRDELLAVLRDRLESGCGSVLPICDELHRLDLETLAIIMNGGFDGERN